MRSIQTQLLLWLSFGILLATGIAGAGIYYRLRNETNKLFDYQLQQTAMSLPAHVRDDVVLQNEALEEDILVQVWNRYGKLIYSSIPTASMPHYKQQGFQTVTAFDEDWRLYIENRRSNFIQIAQPLAVRDALAANLATNILLPFFLLIPVMLVLAVMIVRRNLAPLEGIARTLGQRSPIDLQALPLVGLPLELSTIVGALNGWLERLDRSLSVQRDFVADAAHELRSPFTALKLQLQLTERAKTEEQRLTGFGKLHERLNRAIHLVEQLLTLARNESVTSTENHTTVVLNSLVRSISADYSVLPENRQIHFQVAVDETDILIRGNPHSLPILLKNLLENAFNHTPPDGLVCVQAGYENGQAILRVTDTGKGIAPQDRERVFDRFYRCPGDAVPGTGLGLAIVQNIALQHRAEIRLEDNPVGHGLQVTVVFPADSRLGQT